ncbi:hypothetical protein UFOVP275_24 [uncultured Caudovirales phage]|uniref:Uncharacterized protein n=1 Tax=uncultured Caudovirales phage TaxID=2100421 RepID=A0A6J5LT05_9CAUD|nr:hypothetical protein UFOVP275_24 [uncultured Caudovirales phage]
MTQTIITAGDATVNNVAIQGGDDGTMVLKVGAAGSKVNALSFAADGTPTLLKVPVNATAQSMVRVNTSNGYGSTNTVVRRFSNVVTNQGSDITYADSATLGATFTVNTNGVYSLSYSENYGGTGQFCITVNGTQFTVGPNSINANDRAASGATSTAGVSGTVANTMYLAAGSVVRASGDGSGAGTNGSTQFTITRVA